VTGPTVKSIKIDNGFEERGARLKTLEILLTSLVFVDLFSSAAPSTLSHGVRSEPAVSYRAARPFVCITALYKQCIG
jgi:hypothetical protein